MTLKASILLVAFAAAFSRGNGCPPSPQPPTPDASDAAPPPMPPPSDGGSQTTWNLACAGLALSGCSEGQKPNCAARMQQRAQSGIGNDNPTCLANCKDKACVHACKGDVACP